MLSLAALLFTATATSGCMAYLHYASFGLIKMSGAIIFEKRGDGPPASGPATNPQVYPVTCSDAFVASEGRTVTGSQAGEYSTSCFYQGQHMPWRVLGVFHAAPVAASHWDDYRGRVASMAGEHRCPAVAIRTSPPTQNQEGEAFGAFCVAP